MIFDQLSCNALYRNLGPRFAAGFDYLMATDLAELPDGEHEILGRAVRAVVQTYQTKPLAEGRWEAHRHHADIQYVIRGCERMGVAPLATMRVQPPYDEIKDVEFYEGSAQFFEVAQGSFAPFLPHDVHMPSLAVGEPAAVKKVVVKVSLR